MTKPRSERLQRVTDIATKRTDEAAGAFAEQLRGLDAARGQLEELERFRCEYARPSPAPRGSGTPVAALLNRQQFVARIDQAIGQQQREIEQRVQRLARARAAWLQSRSRSTALDNVTERCRSEERAGEERAEQAALDDRAQYRKGPMHPS